MHPRDHNIFYRFKEDLSMRTKKRSLAVLVGILGVVMLAAACHKKVTAPPPAPPPPPPPPAPTVTLTAEPSTIDKGQSVTLSWSSQNATDLDLEPGVGKVQASGSSSVTPQDSTTYTLTATGPGGTQSATARVTVSIPPPPPPPPPQVTALTDDQLFSQNVKDAYFDFDKSNIRPDAEQVLGTDASFLKEHQSIKFTIEGHCDERGSEEYNLGLGDRRATAAKTFLVNAGVSADAISTISYGKSRPVCTDKTEDCWQQNRRAHFQYGAESK
jgi:peptidoglycan-associated lipoprotein